MWKCYIRQKTGMIASNIWATSALHFLKCQYCQGISRSVICGSVTVSKLNKLILSTLSIHPFSSAYSGSGRVAAGQAGSSRHSSSQQDFQLLQVDPEAFPDGLCNPSSKFCICFQSVRKNPKNLKRKAPRMHPTQMPKLPQLLSPLILVSKMRKPTEKTTHTCMFYFLLINYILTYFCYVHLCFCFCNQCPTRTH